MSQSDINPCKCGSKKEPFADSDDFVMCWIVTCPDCYQKQHARFGAWTYQKAVDEWNKNNPKQETVERGGSTYNGPEGWNKGRTV